MANPNPTPTMDALWAQPAPQPLDAADVDAWADWILALPPEQQATLAAAMDKARPDISKFVDAQSKFIADNDLPNPNDLLKGQDDVI